MGCGKPCNCPTYREHLLSVSVGASAMPTRRLNVNEIDERQAQWDKDDEAYARLRKEGLQPASNDGAAVLERDATDRMEVEMGRVDGDQLMVGNQQSNPELVKEMKEGKQVADHLKEEGII